MAPAITIPTDPKNSATPQSPRHLALAQIFNRYGAYLAERSAALGIPADLAAAVLYVESGGRSSVTVGGVAKSVLRFETHRFYNKYTRDGKDSARVAKFHATFHRGPKGARWKEQKFFRADNKGGGQFIPLHTGKDAQAKEREALALAAGLDEVAAYESTSGGMGQVMGENYKTLGYPSARAMFDAFDMSGDHGAFYQAEGMFTYIEKDRKGAPLRALRAGNVKQFVQLYNGTGQVEEYAKRIVEARAAYNEVARGRDTTPRSPLILPPRLPAPDPYEPPIIRYATASPLPSPRPGPTPIPYLAPPSDGSGFAAGVQDFAAGIAAGALRFAGAAKGAAVATGDAIEKGVRWTGRAAVSGALATRDAAVYTWGVPEEGVRKAARFSAEVVHRTGQTVVAGAKLTGRAALALGRIIYTVPVRDGELTGPFLPSVGESEAAIRFAVRDQLIATGKEPGAVPFDRVVEIYHAQYNKTQREAEVGAGAAVFVNGILTSFASHAASAQAIATATRRPVVGVYNATGGFTLDIRQALNDKIGYPSSAFELRQFAHRFTASPLLSSENKAVLTLLDLIRRYGDAKDADEKQEGRNEQNAGALKLIAHSQGSIIVAEALRLARREGVGIERMDVTTYGNAIFSLPKGPTYRNYVFPHDPVNWAVGSRSPIALVSYLAGKDIQPVIADTTVLSGHPARWAFWHHHDLYVPGEGQSYIKRTGMEVEQAWVHHDQQFDLPGAEEVTEGAPERLRIAPTVQRFGGSGMADAALSGLLDPGFLRAGLLARGGVGSALPETAQTALAPFVGRAVSTARIHGGTVAADAAAALDAAAFTIGDDVFFGAGRFDPTTPRGLGLLAHELIHVRQQSGEGRGGAEIMEGEAQAVGRAVASSFALPCLPAVSRYEIHYEPDGPELSDSDGTRLARIAPEALEEALRRLSALGLPPATLDTIEVAIDLDLQTLSDREATDLWATALVRAVRAALPTDSIVGKGDRRYPAGIQRSGVKEGISGLVEAGGLGLSGALLLTAGSPLLALGGLGLLLLSAGRLRRSHFDLVEQFAEGFHTEDDFGSEAGEVMRQPYGLQRAPKGKGRRRGAVRGTGGKGTPPSTEKPDISDRFRFSERPTGRGGFVRRMEGYLGIPGAVRRIDDRAARRRVSALTGDDAGHLIAAEFGGPSDERNLSRQNWKMNRSGTYRGLERRLGGHLRDGWRIYLTVEDHYVNNPDRPRYRKVAFTMNKQGEETVSRTLLLGNFTTPESRAASIRAGGPPAFRGRKKGRGTLGLLVPSGPNGPVTMQPSTRGQARVAAAQMFLMGLDMGFQFFAGRENAARMRKELARREESIIDLQLKDPDKGVLLLFEFQQYRGHPDSMITPPRMFYYLGVRQAASREAGIAAVNAEDKLQDPAKIYTTEFQFLPPLSEYFIPDDDTEGRP